MREYKVMTQNDRFFAGKFDHEKLESAINSYAAQGWQVVTIALVSIPSFSGWREKVAVVMEKGK
jgi:hypothetical protein